MTPITDTVKHLIIVNVLFFLASFKISIMNDVFPLYSFVSPKFHWYQMITHMFMHGGVTHIAFNMFALYSFGSILEHFWGSKKFLFFYISCGLAAAIANNFANQFILNDTLSVAVGASGAIYGLLVAFAFMFPDEKLAIMFIPIPIKAKFFVPIYMLLYDGFFGIFGNSFFAIDSNIAHFAHIGGAIAGLLIMLFWKNSQFDKHRWN